MLVVNDGTVWSFSIENDTERDWVEDRVHLESWQRRKDGTFVVDHRFGAELAVRMQSEGIELNDGSPKAPTRRRQARKGRASSKLN